jgi:hypothetical protein
MSDNDTDRRVTELLEHLGPADPPQGFVRQVMDSISREDRHQAGGQVVPFRKGESAMVRKAMWGLAAAAAILLGIYTVTGFPPVERGTEGTIGAAQKYQAAQLSEKDVVLGDQEAQEFIQSETFDRLLKDPDARALLLDKGLQSQLKNLDFVRSIRTAEIRDVLASQALANVLRDSVARADLLALIRMNLSADAAAIQANGAVAQLLQNNIVRQALFNPGIKVALLDPAFVASLLQRDFAAHLSNANFVASIQARGFQASMMNGQLNASLLNR